MEFHLLPIFTFLSVTLVASHAALSPEAYWNSVLPNTPMPMAVKNLLPTEATIGVSIGGISVSRGDKDSSWTFYTSKAGEDHDQLHHNPDATLFFLEKDMKQGTRMNLDLAKDAKGVLKFIPRPVSQSMPFSSNKFPEILNLFSIKPNSAEAEIVKKTIRVCEEDSGIKGEQKYCATSLESMIDFCTSKLGKKVEAVSTELEKETPQLQQYRIAGFKKIGGGGGGEVVVCHMHNYAYAVFSCHNVHSSKAYMVSLEGTGTAAEGGAKAKGVAVCHEDTTAWNPKHMAFQMLNVKPGTVPICHILPEDNIAWLPS